MSAHTNFNNPGTTPSGRKVIRRREKEREKRKERKRKEREKTMNLVATTFATQPVCNTTRAAHALHLDQLMTRGGGGSRNTVKSMT
jgi:hypothetical protein